MAVEVITTRSTHDLDQYLTDKKLNTAAGKITAIAPYLGKDFSLICAWVAHPLEAIKARSLQIDFPTPKVFFPLQPTNVYTSPVKTSIFVKGWFQMDTGNTPRWLKCRQGHGWVYRESGTDKGENFDLTLVELTTDATRWDRDLLLEPGAPLSMHLARQAFLVWIVLVVGVGLLAGLNLPWMLVAPGHRQWTDWLLAGISGVMLVLSVYASALVLLLWLWTARGRHVPTPVSDLENDDPPTPANDQWCLYVLPLAVRLLGGVVLLAGQHMLLMSGLWFGLDSWMAAWE